MTKPGNDNSKVVRNMIIISAVIICTSIAATIIYHLPGFSSDPDFELIYGVIFGVVTTGFFFYFIERHQQRSDEKLADQKEQLEKQNKQLEEQKQQLEQNNKHLQEIFKTYAARTALISLKVIFSKGDERAPRNDETREKYLAILKREYLDKYPDHKESIKQIYDIALLHQVQSHGHETCNQCKEIVEKIEKILKNEVTHPFS